MKNYLIKIDELEEIIFKLTTMEIAKDKACELISEICEKRALTIPDVVPKEELTLEQAIEKAKINMDKIKDVDKHLDDIS